MTEQLCRQCGQALGVQMTCPSCGAENTYGGRPRTVLEGMDDPVGGSLLPGGMEVGSLVREYRLVRKLGEGGMGEVYEARHDLTHQHVAIKVVAPELLRDDNTRRRFVEEARVMAGLDHHNIVRLHTFIEEQGRFFLVMEFLVGESLEERLEKGPLPLDEGIRVMRGLLEALSYAHTQENPVIHRDVKPGNVMLCQDGRVVLTDFGIAKAEGRERLTRTRGVVGTYEYMSPEQIQGAQVDGRSDLYSAGVVLYQVITGVVPFPQKTDTGIDCMNGHMSGAAPRLAEYVEGGAGEYQALVDRALAKRPEQRFQSAQEFLRALGRPSAVTAPVPPPATERPMERDFHLPGSGSNKTALWVGLGVVAVAAVVLAVSFATKTDQGVTEATAGRTEKSTAKKEKVVKAAEPIAPEVDGRLVAEEKAQRDLQRARQLELARLEQERHEAQLAVARAEAQAAKEAAAAARAEAKRQEEATRRAEAERAAEAVRRAEAERRAEEERQAEAARRAEAERRAEEERQAEAARRAAEQMPSLPSGQTIAIQAAGAYGWQKSALSDLRQQFVNVGWNKVFPMDYAVSPEGNQIRYYYSSDEWMAERVGDYVQTYLRQKGIHVNMMLRPMLDFRPKPRNSGLIEIWLEL